MEPQGQVYRGLPLQTTGIFQSGFGFSALLTGTIIEAAVVIDTDSGGGLENFTGPWLFGLNVNGVPVLTTTERPSIDTGALSSVKTGLSEAVTQGDWIEFYVDERVAGSIRGPITVWVRILPTSATIADADTIIFAHASDSNKLKSSLWSAIKTALTAVFDTLYVALTGAQTIAGVKTFSSDPIIPDEVYGAGWNGSLEPPTKNAVYDKVESLSGVTDGDKGDITVSGGGATWTADADAVVKMAGAQTVAGVKTFSSDPLIPDEAYDATNWNGVLEPPTKNAVRDKIEDILDGATFTGDIIVPDEAYDATNWDGSLEVPTKNALRDKIETIVAGAGDVATDTIFDAKGDIPVGTGADAANNLPVGTDGQVLTADSGETMGVKWAAAAGSGITRSVVTSSGNFTAGATALTDYVYLLAGAHIPTMPTAVGNTNKYTFKNHHTARIAFSTTSSQTIDGSASTAFYIFPGEEIVLYSDGANWATSVRNKWRTIVKRVDEARVSTTTLANDAELELPMDAAGIYHARLKIYFQADTTPDFKFATTGPTAGGGGGALNSYWGYASSAGATAPTHTQGYVASTSILHSSYNFGHITIDFRILVGATPGTFAFQFAQVTSSANDCYVMSPSTIEWLKVV